LNKKYSFIIQSLGCKVNQYDGMRLAEALMKFGFEPAGNSPPDLFILNGCAVTGRASQKCRQAINSARGKWPNSKVFISGCETKYRELSGGKISDVDVFLPPLPSEMVLRQKLSEAGFALEDQVPDSFREGKKQVRTRAFLKIQDGCRHFCTYCIVPHLRGEEVSKPLPKALEEARELAAEGHKEIVLTGIHLGRFQYGLVDLLEKIAEIPDISRIRLSSIEPLEVEDRLLHWMATSPKACKHLHLPLQSGSDKILSAMNRPYRKKDFSTLVEKIREKMPKIGLSTDLIVGFPGESEADFEESLAFVEKMRFSRIHIFRFSPRQGTPAAEFPEQVSPSEKKERARRAEEIHRKLSAAFHFSFLNSEVEILWEKKNRRMWTGFTREYIPCLMEDDAREFSGKITMGRVIFADWKFVRVVSLP